MTNRMHRILRDEKGVTALETAIILIAFVVVASVFAFTILSAGMNSTEQSKVAINSGLSEVQGSLEVKGNVIATGDTANGYVKEVIVTVSTVAGGQPMDISHKSGPNSDNVVVISYRDGAINQSDVNWSTEMLGTHNDNGLLDPREMVEITVPITGTDSSIKTPLIRNQSFVLEIKPPQGGVLVIERTIPPTITTVMDLQ
jgi:flagellin FlaB